MVFVGRLKNLGDMAESSQATPYHGGDLVLRIFAQSASIGFSIRKATSLLMLISSWRKLLPKSEGPC